jgi:hypothetical protein
MSAETSPPLAYAGRWMAEQLLREIEAWCAIMRERPQDCQSGVVPMGSGRWEDGIRPHLALAPARDKPAWEAALAKAREYQTLRAALLLLVLALVTPGCDARRCQDTVRVLPSGGGSTVCDPTATATIQQTDKGPTVVCTCPKDEPATASGPAGASGPGVAPGSTVEGG